MGWTELLSFALAVSLLVMSPGPNGVLIAKTVPLSGRAAGFANIAGFICAFHVHGTLAVFGVSLILVHSSQAFAAFKLLGAAYLCWLGVKSLVSALTPQQGNAPVAPAIRRRSLPVAFAEGFLTNALNPKVSVFYLAVFPQFIPHAANGEAALAVAYGLVLLHSLINAVWFGAMVIVLSRLRGATIGNQHLLRWLKIVTGMVFIGFGLKLATLRAAS